MRLAAVAMAFSALCWTSKLSIHIIFLTCAMRNISTSSARVYIYICTRNNFANGCGMLTRSASVVNVTSPQLSCLTAVHFPLHFRRARYCAYSTTPEKCLSNSTILDQGLHFAISKQYYWPSCMGQPSVRQNKPGISWILTLVFWNVP